MDVTGVVVASGFTILSAVISIQINQHVQNPYMDEIFHIPQAQKYCQGKFLEVSTFKTLVTLAIEFVVFHFS